MPSSDDTERGNLKPPPETKDTVAVALHQAKETDRAPKVVAAGRGGLAEQILQIAFAQGIKVREDADLAQLLSAVGEDSEIPTEAFAAVAEILCYLYRANG
ncbi:MAG: EscU/YscU/HrcU family type III secretion system export apparatus switch protein, partial [Rhodospirillaceae bacterium]